MNVDQERSRSPWIAIPAQRLGSLKANERAEVVVIGAGIAGLSVAYELALEGRDVVVLDAGRFGRGQTARTTAHLTFAVDDYYQTLEDKHGEAGARAWLQSQSAAVDRVEAICKAEGIDCDFARVDGYWVAADSEGEETLRKEYDAARRAGVADLQSLDAGPPGFEGATLRFGRQGRFHPLKYLDGMIAALRRLGARLYDETPVTAVKQTDAGVEVSCSEGGPTVLAGSVVVATNAPIHQKVAIHTKQAPYRTYAIAAEIPRGAAADVLVWDTVRPYHYVRLQPGAEHDLLIVGGEDHKTGAADDGVDRIGKLEAWARARFPSMGRVVNAWSGQVYEPADGVGFIGQSPSDAPIFLVTGDSGQGITTGVAAGLILRDLVQGRDNPWARLYHPSRKPTKALGEYVRENLTAVKSMAEHLIDPHKDDEEDRSRASVDDLAPGEGALVRVGAKKVAAYRDEQGALHVRSAACSHVGCAIRWNSFETCWDCPCHGSQFSVDGEPLNAPAFTALKPAGAEADEAARKAPSDTPAARP